MSDCTCLSFPDRLCFCHLYPRRYPHRADCHCNCPEGWPTRQTAPQPYLPKRDQFREKVIAVILDVPS